jgi:hypothetical protein
MDINVTGKSGRIPLRVEADKKNGSGNRVTVVHLNFCLIDRMCRE